MYYRGHKERLLVLLPAPVLGEGSGFMACRFGLKLDAGGVAKLLHSDLAALWYPFSLFLVQGSLRK